MKEKLPQDTNTKIYIENIYDYSIFELLLKCYDKWGVQINIKNLKIDFEEIQVKCFNYDQHDPGDYRNYFVITLDTPISV
jgi:hypothetical protein